MELFDIVTLDDNKEYSIVKIEEYRHHILVMKKYKN